jgi:hypothetical protein
VATFQKNCATLEASTGCRLSAQDGALCSWSSA